MDFSSVHNIHESAVFEAVTLAAPRFPGISGNSDLLADVACVALNRVSARYIRHDVDLAFFLTERERAENERAITESVEYAFSFVQARHAMAARR
ncbi:late competence development ComFB family protein [Aquabacterium sp.]|uniref:late competence development ComFB family protein n=1 Tax=Aquabacterium sp. TaxID=1872578 RepID=UPI002C97091C|nr:late competence development ComFB family protein [Aquabacterium sp.]HSW08886.1 late competence development ComFB family protein [Aquabacterium sp.]